MATTPTNYTINKLNVITIINGNPILTIAHSSATTITTLIYIKVIDQYVITIVNINTSPWRVKYMKIINEIKGLKLTLKIC